MSIEDIIRTISFIVAPAVMISACTLFLNGLLARYESISARMRSMHRERLDLLQAAEGTTKGQEGHNGFGRQRVQEIEYELPNILHRHKLIRNAVLSVNFAIIIFVISMFMIAAAVISNFSTIGAVALFTFLLGTGALLVGVATTSVELARSQREVSYEISHGLSLTEKDMHY